MANIPVYYFLDPVDEIIIRAIMAKPGIIMNNLAQSLHYSHNLTRKDVLVAIHSAISNGLITNDYGQLRPVNGLKIENGRANIEN
jgi:hypothetical protein